jgi:hypothetical protein
LVHLCYLVATSTGSKLQLFQRWREWELVHVSILRAIILAC